MAGRIGVAELSNSAPPLSALNRDAGTVLLETGWLVLLKSGIGGRRLLRVAALTSIERSTERFEGPVAAGALSSIVGLIGVVCSMVSEVGIGLIGAGMGR
jgi:hypothetical protein